MRQLEWLDWTQWHGVDHHDLTSVDNKSHVSQFLSLMIRLISEFSESTKAQSELWRTCFVIGSPASVDELHVADLG